MPQILRLILGDQLNAQHSWFKKKNPAVTYVMMEIRPEATYVTHHIQKLLGFFAAMRRFAQYLRKQGHEIIYLKFDQAENHHSFEKNINELIKKKEFERFQYQEPDEYRLDQQLKGICKRIPIETEMVSSEHFLTGRYDLRHMFADKKTPLMESFYRRMRLKHNLLMDGNKPISGRWNYDNENRKKLDPDIVIPDTPNFKHNISSLKQLITDQKIPYIGTVDSTHFRWPLKRSEALSMLGDFLENRLHNFGTYQDAMHSGEPFIFHSLLSFALNTKMINPLEVCRQAIDYWQRHQDRISLAQIEGFIRQIIGWREYMRGIYWAYMPDYEKSNYFNHQQPLPEFYWTAQTKMNCLKQVIGQSLNHAYAHHIQRLMISGNFALLAGIDPDEVDRWYLGIYIDAIQWVELPNTRGMSQFADGGIVGTKPYVSTANYINKMSDYCQACSYDPKKRYGRDACPFNSLYWDFYLRHQNKLNRNPRIGMAYRQLARMDSSEIKKIQDQAGRIRMRLEEL